MENKTLPQDQIEEITRRRLICATCPYMSKNKPGYATSRTDEHCTLCGCPIANKTASLTSNCGIETYNNSHPNNPLPLKWTAYKTPDGEKSSEHKDIPNAPHARVLPQ